MVKPSLTNVLLRELRVESGELRSIRNEELGVRNFIENEATPH